MKREIDESMLIDFLAGRLSRSEQAMVEEWYDESEQHKKILEDIYYISVLCNCAEVVKNIDVEYSLRQLRKRVAENERRAKSRFPVLLRDIRRCGHGDRGLVFRRIEAGIGQSAFRGGLCRE